jgi:hypothetical protein
MQTKRRDLFTTARLWADTWCAVFVWKKDTTDLGRLCPTERQFRNIELDPHNIHPAVRDEIRRLREQYQFSHWYLAFSDVFGMRSEDDEPSNEQTGWTGGFDVVLGNPPWEQVKLQEKEWFAERCPEIAIAPNAAARKRLIQSLKTADPALYQRFLSDCRKAEGESVLMRNSGRYPLCGRGDVNTYTIFAELNFRALRDITLGKLWNLQNWPLMPIRQGGRTFGLMESIRVHGDPEEGKETKLVELENSRKLGIATLGSLKPILGSLRFAASSRVPPLPVRRGHCVQSCGCADRGARRLGTVAARAAQRAAAVGRGIPRSLAQGGCPSPLGARHHGLHELIHMLPGLFCLYLVMASLALAIHPALALIASVPGALYGVVLAILAIQRCEALP